MKNIIICVLVFCLLAFGAVMAFSQSVPSGNVRWEYTQLDTAGGLSINRANQLGQEGWEIVTNYESSSSYFIVFKRRLP